MDKKQTIKQSHAVFEARNQKFVTCPHCWTEQRTNRDFCYQCGAKFHYLDEDKNSKAV